MIELTPQASTAAISCTSQTKGIQAHDPRDGHDVAPQIKGTVTHNVASFAERNQAKNLNCNRKY